MLDFGNKIKVLILDPQTFEKYVSSVQSLINENLRTAESIEMTLSKLRTESQRGTLAQDSQERLHMNEDTLGLLCKKIEHLQKLLLDIKSDWSKTENRVIGFVRWAPPVGVSELPHQYTRDLCVVELYKEKFSNMIGNVLSLGVPLVPLCSEHTDTVDFQGSRLYSSKTYCKTRTAFRPNTSHIPMMGFSL